MSGRQAGAFAKLSLFGLTQYSRLLYLDADTLPVVDLHYLFDLPMHGAPLGATGESFMGARSLAKDWFNCGVMLIAPDHPVDNGSRLF